MLTAPRLWLKQSFWIAQCSVIFLGCLLAHVQHVDVVLGLDAVVVWGRFWRDRRLTGTMNLYSQQILAVLLAKSWEHKEYIKPVTILANRKQKTRQRTRLKVTVCLYLNPSNSARSLSTLMAVAVARENPQKMKFKVLTVMWRIYHLLQSICIKKAAKSGWTITPIQKSLIAGQESKNFVGGWINDTLWSAMRMRVLPSVAVKARKTLKEKMNTKNGLWSITHWKLTWSWELSVLRNVHRSFEIRTRSRPRIEKMRSGV